MNAVQPQAEVLSPAQKLAASREKLQQALKLAHDKTSKDNPEHADAEAAWWAQILQLLPNAGLWHAALHSVLGTAWADYPVQSALASLAKTVGFRALFRFRRLLRTFSQEHPYQLLFGTVLIGVVLSRLRPWRWRLKSSAIRTLLPQVVFGVLRRILKKA